MTGSSTEQTAEAESTAASPEATQEHPAQGSVCPACSSALTPDQRYCLNCGARLPETPIWVPPRVAAAPEQPVADQPVFPAQQLPRDITPLAAIVSLVALAAVLVAGVLIGRSSQNDSSKAASSPQVITVPATSTPITTPTAITPTTTTTPVLSDWPAGRSAWTVKLQTVPKSGASETSISADKATALGKGAPAVGVLDGASYSSLGNDYIIYSGIYSSQKAANTALQKLKKSYPAATVVHVVSPGATGSVGSRFQSPHGSTHDLTPPGGPRR